MRCKRSGTVHKAKTALFEKLQFLDILILEEDGQILKSNEMEQSSQLENDFIGSEEQVITDNQEYYEVSIIRLSLISTIQLA